MLTIGTKVMSFLAYFDGNLNWLLHRIGNMSNIYMLNISYFIDILSSISNYIDFLHLIWLCLPFRQHELSNDVKVMLRRLNIKSSGVYRCEISAEAPNFSSVEGEGRMEIVCKFSYKRWQYYHTHAH